MSFRVPESSSPPSTPDRSRHTKLDGHPSTTPAGPPPSSLTAFSTTPAGNPPASSFFGTGSNGSGVAPPSFNFTNRQPRNSSPLRAQHYPEDEEADRDEEPDRMDEDGIVGQDFMDYSQVSRDDILPSAETLNLHEIAKGLATNAPRSLQEPDSVILQTEQILDKLSEAVDQDSSGEAQSLSSITQALLDVWKQAFPLKPSSNGIGPGNDSPPPTKALFLAGLILQIHHPSLRASRLGASRQNVDPIPKVLLQWLQQHHYPFKDDFEDAFDFDPNPASHERFWDIVFNTTLRGNIKDSLELLRNADFSKAATAVHDGAQDDAYQGKELANTDHVVKRAIQVLESCPAAQSGDWNVKGSEWMIFRRRVQQAMNDLESCAEDGNADRYSNGDSNFEASRFGMRSKGSDLTISQRSRQAESKVPWSIYTNLMYLYGQLMGTPSELVAASSDWVEASIGITVWWDGEDADFQASRSLGGNRRLSKSLRRQDRLVDTHTQAAYLRKLSEALMYVQDNAEGDAELEINPTDAVQVGLGCVFVSELEGLLRLLKGWSPTVAAAVVEIADRGGWLGRARPSDGMIDGFNQSDLMVLSYAQQRGLASDHDTVLSEYAQLLAERSELVGHNITREGWQMAIEVLGRLHDESLAGQRIGELLDELDFGDAAQVDETVRLCGRIGLQEHAKRISERYGDNLAENTHSYGAAIMQYTRAGASGKIYDILHLLTSLSLVQSMAYPPANELDSSLRTLIETPRQTMARLAVLDPDTSASLMHHLSGYATIRRFYELRDQEHLQSKKTSSAMRPLARKKEALSNLVSLIQSASDGIHGGLFDASVDTAIPIDGLLVLLGEMLPFVNHSRSLLSHEQTVAVLKAVEDLSVASSTIFDQCRECFASAMASAHGSAPPSPRSTLKQSISNMSGSHFSLIGSEMLQQSQPKSSGSNSGVLVKGPVKRGWDWRKGFDRNAHGEDVLKILRLGLAMEMSRTWLMRG